MVLPLIQWSLKIISYKPTFPSEFHYYKVQFLHVSLLIVINSYKLLDGVRENSNWYNDDQPKNKKPTDKGRGPKSL